MSLPDKLLRKFSLAMGMTNTKDKRSYHFVGVIDCIMNQNTRDAGAAAFPAMNWQILQLCHQYNVGILQMPCPEIAFLGFARARPPGKSIRAALETQDGKACCRKLSTDIADRIEETIRQNAECLAILGGNPESPGCAVHAENAQESTPSGVLITELRDELQQRNIQIPFRGIRDFDATLMAEDLGWLNQLFVKKKL